MKKQVLIADADFVFAKELSRALEESGKFQVIDIALNGRQAVRMVEERRPDVLVMDILLPELDGLCVLDCISNLCPSITAFVATGFISNYIADALAARHISGLLKKPCTAQCVVDQIRDELTL